MQQVDAQHHKLPPRERRTHRAGQRQNPTRTWASSTSSPNGQKTNSKDGGEKRLQPAPQPTNGTMAKHGTSGGHRQHDATPLREFIQEQWEAWDTVHYNMKEEESVGYRPQGITSRGRKRRASTKIELTPKRSVWRLQCMNPIPSIYHLVI